MKPLVTIITPTTKDRSEFNERISQIAACQDYPHIEHLVNTDNIVLGTKRNLLCSQAKGEIILHMDSDDIYAPDWVSRSVEALLSSEAEVTGLKNGYFYNPYDNKAWLYRYSDKNNIPYVLGATMCYFKKTWERCRFLDVREGEDNVFCKKVTKVAAHDYTNGFIATIHGYNTSSHQVIKNMKGIKPELVENIINSLYNTV